MDNTRRNRIRELSNEIIQLVLARVPKRYTTGYGRWVWATGFLASWIARIAVNDITVRQQIKEYQWDNERKQREIV